ncbi:hypothetical protein D3C72_1829590 [compost metagenome]
MSTPSALISLTGTSAARNSSPNSSRTHVFTAESAASARSLMDEGRTARAPSPPKTKGMDFSSSAFISAEMTLAPAMFTALYRPSAMAPVELTISARASTQPSGKAR